MESADKRPDVLESKTYKIKPPTLTSAMYITISNNTVDGELRPVEVFINCKDMQNFEWVTSLTRQLSSQFRQSGPFPSYAIEELIETYDTTGGYFIPKSHGVHVHSMVGHIGKVIKKHCQELGVMKK